MQAVRCSVHATDHDERDLDGIIASLLDRFSSPSAAQRILDDFDKLAKHRRRMHWYVTSQTTIGPRFRHTWSYHR